MKKRKLQLSKETIRSIEAGRASGGSRVRCGPGTYAASCAEACPSYDIGCTVDSQDIACFTSPEYGCQI